MADTLQPRLLYERAPCPKCGATTEIEADETCHQSMDFTGEWSCPGEKQDGEGFLIQPTRESRQELDIWCVEQVRKEENSRVDVGFHIGDGVYAVGIKEAGRLLTDVSYGAAKQSGWHGDLETGMPRTFAQNDVLFPTRIALCHSELSESLEGHRKGIRDDKLPNRFMAEVELADAVIRIFDLAGAMGYDLGAAIEEKLIYNSKRADHQRENRKKPGGKSY